MRGRSAVRRPWQPRGSVGDQRRGAGRASTGRPSGSPVGSGPGSASAPAAWPGPPGGDGQPVGLDPAAVRHGQGRQPHIAVLEQARRSARSPAAPRRRGRTRFAPAQKRCVSAVCARRRCGSLEGAASTPHRWQTSRPVGPRRPGMVRMAGVHAVLLRRGGHPEHLPDRRVQHVHLDRPRPAGQRRPASRVPNRTAVGSCPARRPRRTPAGRYAAGARRGLRGARRHATGRRAPPGGRTPAGTAAPVEPCRGRRPRRGPPHPSARRRPAPAPPGVPALAGNPSAGQRSRLAMRGP